LVLEDPLDKQVFKEPLDTMDRVPKELKELAVRVDQQVPWEVQTELPVLRVRQQDHLEHRDTQGTKVRREQGGLRVHKVPKERRVLKEHRGRKDIRVPKVTGGQLGQWELKVLVSSHHSIWVLKEQQDPLVPLERIVPISQML
jgi:hypothetical protein